MIFFIVNNHSISWNPIFKLFHMSFTPYQQALAGLPFIGGSNIIKRTQSTHDPVQYARFPTWNLDVCVGWARKAVNIIARLRRPRIGRKMAQNCFSSTFYYLYPRFSVVTILTLNFSDFPSQQRSLISRNKENRTKVTGHFSTGVGQFFLLLFSVIMRLLDLESVVLFSTEDCTFFRYSLIPSTNISDLKPLL